jgi:hypothetical protein
MKFAQSIVLAWVGVVALATPALCQQTTDGADRSEPRYLTANVGGAVLDSETVATFAVEYGERISRHVQAYANLSYVDNVMTDTMRDNLVLAADALTTVSGSTYTFSGRDRGLAFTAGGKLVVPGRTFRPYAGAGIGGIQLRRTIHEASLGDVTTSFVTETGLSDGVLNVGDDTTSKPLGEIVAGVGINARKGYIDIGYRFRKVFHTSTPIDFSQLGVGFGIRF